jgi:hypothetical protein
LRSGDCSNGWLLLKSRPTHDNRGTLSTVGISFGSPTSGQGFDVSSTVRQIIANLQAVETPWNTELRTLHSENTVLISISTDLIRSQAHSIQSPLRRCVLAEGGFELGYQRSIADICSLGRRGGKLFRGGRRAGPDFFLLQHGHDQRRCFGLQGHPGLDHRRRDADHSPRFLERLPVHTGCGHQRRRFRRDRQRDYRYRRGALPGLQSPILSHCICSR